MEPTHSLLKRQLKRHFGDHFRVPAEWQEFVNAVGAAYREFDFDREMLERSLELSSQELLSANSELRALFQAIPDLMFRLDRDGTILEFKAGTTSDLLLQRQQLFGKRIQDIPLQPVSNQFLEAIQRVTAEKAMVRFEYSLKLQSQESFYEARLLPLPEEQIVAIVQNITDRKRTEAFQARQARQASLRADVNQAFALGGASLPKTLQACSEAVVRHLDAAFARIWTLNAKESVLELQASSGIYKHLDGPHARVPVGALKIGLIAQERKPHFTNDVINDPRVSDREWAKREGMIAFAGHPLVVENRLVGVLGLFARHELHEDTLEALGSIAFALAQGIERKRAEEELRRTVSLLQSTLESTADGLLVVDAGGRIEQFNERFVTLWKIPQRILEMRDDQAAIEHVLGQLKDPDTFVRKVKELYAAPQAESFDVLEFKDGRVFERYSCPQCLEGAPVGRVWSFRDVTERAKLEEQFRQVRKMEAFGQLAAGVAHDFNNILTVIRGNLSMLRLSLPTKSERFSCVDQAINAADRAANLTRQLLTFSRRQPLQRKDLDLNEVVANITKMLQRLIGEHIALEAHYAPGNAPIHADPGMMEQVLMNLAINSRDAMPKGGRLILRTTTVSIQDADLRLRPKARAGEFVELSVSDTGAGISPQHLPHIFEPFFTTKETGKGTGLGLATVFGIIEQHQGWIEVESESGEGTTFRMFLPRLSQTAAAALAESSALPEARRGTETILLVEDEVAVRELMNVLLTGHGYQVHEASSGVAAFDVWAQHRDRIHLLVTDMVMPEGINGRELAERLTSEKPGLKVIYCSGYTDDALGADSPLRNNRNFLEKPFEPNALLLRVRHCLDGV
jgi:signal transduction histidine kinase